MSNNITWGCIQPLTGGAYLGTEAAVGHQADWIISFPGLEKEHYNSKGVLDGMGNERHLLNHLKKKNTLPPYYQINRAMFDEINEDEFDNLEFIEPTEYITPIKDFKKFHKKPVDLIVAVPVCSGLSGANTAEHGKQDSAKNNNMKFIATYVLKYLKPKAYIFENAPALYTNVGTMTRDYLNDLAYKAGYSVTYVRTDTHLHDNVQQRIRTFAIFWQWPDGKEISPPQIGIENNPVKDVATFLARIPKSATQNDIYMNEPLKTFPDYRYIINKYGKNWRDSVGRQCFTGHIIDNHLDKEFLKYIEEDKKTTEKQLEAYTKHYTHCRAKKNIDKGFYDSSLFCSGPEKVPTIFFKTSYWLIHPTEERNFSMREIMSFMTMPYDFEYLHTWQTIGQIIGQNVPARTQQFWSSEIVKVLKNWPQARKNIALGKGQPTNVFFHNNVRPEQSGYNVR